MAGNTPSRFVLGIKSAVALGSGMFSMPLIKMQDVSLEKMSLIGYDKINQSDEKEKTVHFFLDDYRFESIYKNPDNKIERLKKFNAVMSPDFSMFTEMPVSLQLYNCFRNRWVGAYLQSKGIKVIPTVRWGSLESFNFCFDGIEQGCTVAVSTLGIKNEKSHFMLGYNEMRRRIRPRKIICYGKPFEDMKGEIIEIDYAETNNLKCFEPICVTKVTGYVLPLEKGGGSAGGLGASNPKPTDNIPKVPFDDLPDNVKKAYIEYEKVGWKGNYKGQTDRTHAGGNFKNIPPKLPESSPYGESISYREYDVNDKIPGKPRDAERFVRGSDGSIYYTDDHYATFTRIK